MKQTIAVLKSFFETGDTPTQGNFADLIDSFFHKDSGVIVSSTSVDSATGTITINFSDGTKTVIQQYTHPNTHTQAEIDNLVSDLSTIRTNIQNLQSNKVDKDGSKKLSDNNFSTALLQKLNSLNNYTKPASEPISYIQKLQDILDGLKKDIDDKKETHRNI